MIFEGAAQPSELVTGDLVRECPLQMIEDRCLCPWISTKVVVMNILFVRTR